MRVYFLTFHRRIFVISLDDIINNYDNLCSLDLIEVVPKSARLPEEITGLQEQPNDEYLLFPVRGLLFIFIKQSTKNENYQQ